MKGGLFLYPILLFLLLLPPFATLNEDKKENRDRIVGIARDVSQSVEFFFGEKTEDTFINDPQRFKLLKSDLEESQTENKMFKFDLEESPTENTTSPCGLGILKTSPIIQNTCIGRICSIIELDCSNETIRSENQTMVTDIEDCLVTKMLCKDAESNLISEVDMQDQYNTGNCQIERMRCQGIVMDNITESMVFDPDCQAEIMCDDFRVYGFDRYGYYCANQQLICDGMVISPDEVNEISDQANCTVSQVRCINVTSTSTCDQYQVCQGMQEGCIAQTISLPCNASTEDARCRIDQLICNGTIVESLVNTSYALTDCYVSQMNCLGEIISVDDYAQDCTASNVQCFGISINPAFVRDTTPCTISALTCPPSNNQSCRYLQTKCEDASCVTHSIAPCHNLLQCPALVTVS
eukprot:TRINITY_DN9135_c0_g1_i2.p1 TRINITY_DN9135_c0_g1~~TRINITY_DN9135_c0_g1_i2.p1  ORF type:complete len:409 (-),score=70.58 TRINITY_DN9135_c0_g1_i2:613-1839(-)